MSSNLTSQVLLDQFRVDTFIASGGMGAVYLVWDLKRNVQLAMKVLHSELADDPLILKRFKREANALKKLAHPNIVPFYGLFRTGDIVFLLERFIDGPSLKEILKERADRKLPVREALTYLKVLSSALGYAHSHSVVHCDVKPGNVMIDPGGNIYLADFGIARHAESTATSVGTVGTPAYMAPEQIRGDEVTPAADVYALGVMAFEMLTGQRPFRGTGSGTEQSGATAKEQIRHGHLNLAPPDPRTLNPNITPAMAGVLLKALSKNPSERYASVQEFYTSLCTASGVDPDQIPNRATVSAAIEQEYQAQPAAGGQAATRQLKRFIPWAVGGALIVLMICGASVALVAPGLIAGSPALTDTPTPNPKATRTAAAAFSPIPAFTSTPEILPSNTPTPLAPVLYIKKNSHCRTQPESYGSSAVVVESGTRYPILKFDRDGWWLIRVDRPGQSTVECWVGAAVSIPEGNFEDVPKQR